MTENFDYRFTIPFSRRLVLFMCIAIVGFVMTQVTVWLILTKFGTDSAPAMRIAAILQDILMFIVPAIATAVVVSRLPAALLCIGGRMPWSSLLMAALTLVAGVPLLNQVVAWNEAIKFPESMAVIEQALRASEETARASIDMLIKGHGIPSLIISILIVGVAAGFSEELFFRGTLQRLLTTGRINHHVAIWVTAFAFSALHMQFFGFFGRLLLGAYMGYLLYWTRSLWVPIIIHALNNTIYIIGTYTSESSAEPSAIDTIGTGSWVVVLFSVALTAAGLYIICMRSRHDNKEYKILNNDKLNKKQ